MKPRAVISDRSCSCASCLYKSDSERLSVRRFVAHGSRIDKLFIGQNLPRREKKLLKRLIRTREVYDDIRTTLLSDHSDSDMAYLKPINYMPMRNERSSTLLELVSLIDRGAGLPHSLSECCSCCVCGGSTIDRQNQRIHKHKHGPLSSRSSMTSGLRGRDQRRGSRHAYRAKNIQSDPCTCTSKTCGDEECDMRLLMKNRPKPVFEQYEGTTLKQEAERRQNVEKYKNRLSGMGESLRRFKLSKENVMDTKNKLKDQYRQRTKRYLNFEHRYSLRHDKKSEEEEEEEIQQAIEDLKRESLIKLKEQKRKIKEDKMRRNVDKNTLRYQVPGPYKDETQYTVGKEKIRRTGEKVPKITAIQTKIDKADARTQKPEELNEANIRSVEKEAQDKEQIGRPGQKKIESGGYALKPCFCTFKLKPKIHKTRLKSRSRNTTETSKSQLSATSIRPVPCDPGVCVPGKCDPNDCLKIIGRRGVSYISSPSNTRKYKLSTKSTSKNVSPSNVKCICKPSLLPYECEPGVCVPGKCDPIECDKLIKKRGSTYASNTELKRQTQSISSLEKLTIGSTQTSSLTSDKAMKIKKEHAEDKHVRKNNISVPKAMAKERKVRAHRPAIERPSQMSRLTKSRNSLTKHKLKRCFCTLKFTKKGKMLVATNSKETLSSGMTTSDMIERPTLRNTSPIIKIKRNKYRHELQKYECEPGICVPNECDPYQCLELIKKRYITQSGSKPFKRKTKSTYSIARNRRVKSRTIQSVSSCLCSQPKQFASNPSPGNRQAVRISSTFSFDIELYKEKGDAKPESTPKPVTMKLEQGNDKSLHRRTKSHHKSTSVQKYTRNKGKITSSSSKHCFCTLKLQKRAKHLATTSSTATETAITKDILYPKVDIKVTRSTKMKRKNIRNLEPYECEPNVCIPGECDPFLCLKRIQLRDKVKSKDFGSSTDNYNKSTASLTSSIISKSKNILVKSDSGRIRKRRKRSKYTTSSSIPKVPIIPNISCSSRQAVRISSNFSFNVEFYKNRSFDNMPEESITVGSKKHKGEVDTGHGAYKTSVNNGKTQSVVKKANKRSWIQPFMKRCFCTLKLQKNNSENPSVNSKRFNPVVMTAQICNDNLEKSDRTQLKYISMKRSVSSKKSVWYRSNMLISSINAISNIWFNSKKSIVSSDMAYNMEKTLRHGRENHGVDSKAYIQQRNIMKQSPFVQKSVCAMNVYGIKRKTHKLKPYECEPGVCIPGQCNPYECQKLIMKRFTKGSSTVTGSGNRSHSTSSDKKQKKAPEQKHGTSRKKKEKQKTAPEVISYKLPPAKSRKQAVRIGSTFNFDVEFFKNRTSDADVLFGDTNNTHQSTISRGRVRKKKGQSVESYTRGRKYHDKGFRSSQVSHETGHSQSSSLTRDMGSNNDPKSKRCFCTLQLKKKGKHQVHEAKAPKIVPYVDTAQNTKKKNKYHLDPNECEPGVCVPGKCDPYKCLEIIKRRKYDSKDFGTGMKSEGKKYPQGKNVQVVEKKTKEKKGQHKQKIERSKPANSISSDVRKPSPLGHRQAIKVGSTFSFDIEFYKDKTAQQAVEYGAVKPTPSQNSKIKKRKDFKQDTRYTNSSKTREIQKSPENKKKKTAGTKSGAFLKRCFCTAKLFAGRRPQKPPKMYTNTSNQTLSYKEKPQKKPRLEPYECEPGVCVPGKCNPIICAEIIKRRNRAAQMSGTDFGDTRSASTSARKRKTNQPKEKTVVMKNKQPKETKTGKKYKQPPSAISSEAPGNRNAVRIGSNFSFNVEFYKINYPEIIRAAKEIKKGRLRKSSTSSELTQRKLKGKGVNKHGRYQNRRSQAVSLGREDKGTGKLKRCFCTLALQADNKEMMTRGTDIPHYKTYPIFDDKNTLTKKLLPYECEPGVCFPGECDPYECLKRIQRRREYGTSTKRRGTSSASSMVREHHKQQSKEKRQEKTKRKGQEIRISKPRQHKQAVKISSVFSFSVEFSKSKSDSQETVITGAREPRMTKYRTYNTGKKREKTGRPTKRMSTLGTKHEKHLQDRDSQAVRNVHSVLTETKPFLKRCFCTLQFKNSEKNRGRAPVNVYTVHTQYKALHNQIDLNTRTRTPAIKQSSSRRSIHRNTAQVESNRDFDVEFLKKLAIDNPYHTQTSHAYPTFVKTGDKLQKNEYLKSNKLKPFECEPYVCVPGKCNPHICLERIQRRYIRDTGVDNKKYCYDKICNVKDKETYPKRLKIRNDVKRNQIGMPNSEDRHSCRVGSSFSCNIEFYKDCSLPYCQNHKSQSVCDTRPRQKTCYQRNTVTNTKTSNKLNAAYIGNARDEHMHATRSRRDMSLGIKPLLQRCFCTLKFQKNKKKQQKIKPPTVDKNIGTNFKHRVLGVLLDPYECEPGVCIPGKCNPYECLERIQKRNCVNRGTDTQQRYEVCRQTPPDFVPGSRSKKIRYEGKPFRDSAIVEIPRAPILHPEYWHGVRIGSNINCSVEFFKDYCICPDAKEEIPVTYKMCGDNKIYRPTHAQGCNQTYKTMPRYNKQICKRMDSTKQTKIDADDKSSIVGKALKRCFCTAKFQKKGLKTPPKNFIVGRVDKLITNSPFQPNNFQIYQSQKNRQWPNYSACNDMKTIYPYASESFNKSKSKTLIQRKGILKKNTCKCCKTICNDMSIASPCSSTTKPENVTIVIPCPFKSFFGRTSKNAKNVESLKVQEVPQNNPKAKPLLCTECIESSKNEKKKKKAKRALNVQEESQNDPKAKPLLRTECIESSKNEKTKKKGKRALNVQEKSQNDPKPKSLPLCTDCIESLKNKQTKKKGKRAVNVQEESQNDSKAKSPPLCTDCIESLKNEQAKKKAKSALTPPADDVDKPCQNCKKHKTCKCQFCKCLFCKFNVKRKAKYVTCRSCKKHLKRKDYGLICAHCGVDFSNEQEVIQLTAKPSKDGINKKSKPANFSNLGAARGDGYVRSQSKNKTNSFKNGNNLGNGDVNSPPKSKTDASKGKPEYIPDIKCADSCLGIKKKGKKIKKNKQLPPPPTQPAPTSAETSPEPNIGFKLSKIGKYKIPLLGKRPPPCVCGSIICATQSRKERAKNKGEPKKESTPEECFCGSSVCKEEYENIQQLKALEKERKEIEEKEAEAKKKKDERKQKDALMKKAKLKKKKQLKKLNTKMQAAKEKKKSHKQKHKDMQLQREKEERATSKEIEGILKKRKLKAQRKAEKKRMKKLKKTLKKKKAIALKKADKLRRRKVKELKALMKRRIEYAAEDIKRRKHRHKIDNEMLRRVKKTKKFGDCALCTDAILDISKLGFVTLGDILRSAFRVVTDPKNTALSVKTLYSDPVIALKSAKDAVVYSGVGSTFKRVALRIGYMERYRQLKDKIESNRITYTLFHMFDKNPKKFKPRRKLRKKEPIDFDCSPYMASLRKHPFLSVWYSCPWFYPHCISLLNVWRQFTDIVLFLLAVVVWCPCLLLWETCRALMCCTMCTA